MRKAWRFEIYDRSGSRVCACEEQSYEDVWIAALDCSVLDRLKFSPPPGAPASEINALLQLGAAPID